MRASIKDGDGKRDRLTRKSVFRPDRAPLSRPAAHARNYRRVSEGVVMLIGGWKTRAVFERYNIKNEDDLRDAAAMVSQKRIGKDWERKSKIRPLKTAAGSRNAR
jgi:hypothetical protein